MANKTNYLGLAGEFRVMSELLLRGHNPAKSYLEDGADLILENGKRIEIKSSHLRTVKDPRYNYRYVHYGFSFWGGHRSRIKKDFDFAICWCVEANVFYIIPVKEIKGSTFGIKNVSPNAPNRYAPYRENWELLK